MGSMRFGEFLGQATFGKPKKRPYPPVFDPKNGGVRTQRVKIKHKQNICVCHMNSSDGKKCSALHKNSGADIRAGVRGADRDDDDDDDDDT